MYQDFDLLVERFGDGYQTSVLNSPTGQASAPFTPPFSENELEIFLLLISRSRSAMRRPDSKEYQTIQAFGGRLFDALFAGQVRNRFHASLPGGSWQDSGIRLRLRFKDAPELARLPWEYLYDASLGQFLMLSRNIRLVRFLDLPEEVKPLPLELPLKILTWLPGPEISEWRERLQESLHDLVAKGLVQIEYFHGLTLPDFQKKLHQQRFHILHYIGKGGYEEANQDSFLQLEDEHGQEIQVFGQELAELLQEYPSLRMVIFNKMNGSGAIQMDPFAGAACSLVHGGLPAVITTQVEITTEVASILTRELYRALAEGHPVDAALTSVRKVIFATNEALDWGIPVLHSGLLDGRIFVFIQKPKEQESTSLRLEGKTGNVETTAIRQKEQPEETPVEEAQEEQLKEWYLSGYQAYRQGNWDLAVEYFQSIMEVRPGYRNSAKVLADARRRVRLNATYVEPQTAVKDDDWDKAEAELETLLQEPLDFSVPTGQWQTKTTEAHGAGTAQESVSQPEASQRSSVQPVQGTLATVTGSASGPPLESAGSFQKENPRKRRVHPVIWAAAVVALLSILLLGVYFFFLRTPAAISANEMVKVPGGAYQVGKGQEVVLEEFWIDKYEVTNREYQQFLDQTRVQAPINWSGGSPPAGKDDHPVSGVRWEQARAYCQSLGKRLPSEAEWEVAARGPFGWLYPWGNTAQAVPVASNGTSPAGNNPANRSYFGAFDMTGNVWEWVQQPYQPVADGQQVIRGGAYDLLYTLDYRLAGDPEIPNMSENTGFRCAADGTRVDPQLDRDQSFEDPFVDNTSGWPEQVNDQFIFNYHPVSWYHLQLTTPETYLPVFYEQERFNTFILETDVFVDSANTDNTSGDFDYGLAIRHDPEQFYAFVISAHQGSWKILKGRYSGESITGPLTDLTELAEGTGTTFINGSTDAKIDRLAVIADGSGFTFSINGQLASYIPADDFEGGNVGMVAIAGQDITKIHIHYDQINLQPIPANQVVIAATGSVVEATPISAPEETESPVVVEEPAGATATPAAPLTSSRRMVQIDEGTFELGSGLNVALGGFWIDRYEVTNREFQEFLDRNGGDPPTGWEGGTMPFGKENYPVSGVSWEQAGAYCQWVGKRLPSEAEWEAAARGPYGWLYPWGNDPEAVPLPGDGTYPVGTFPANRSFYGAYDMAGNVWEWVQDTYLPTPEGQQVIRGGAYNFLKDMRERLEGDPESELITVDTGFRCAADAARVVADEDLILADDFVNVDGEWFQARAPAPVGSYFFGYHPTDFYHLQVSAPEDCLSVIQPTTLDDFAVEVVMYTENTDTEEGEYTYGMVLRESENKFYALVISPRSQRWQALKSTPQGLQLMGEGENPSIQGDTRETLHRLFAVAHGPELFFFVNGYLVLKAYDEDYPTGNFGFIVKTGDETYMHAHYDSMRVWRLQEGVSQVTLPEGPRPDYPAAGPVCRGTVSSAETIDTFVTHQVREGETWISIAARYNLTVEEVMAANGRLPERPGTLRAGSSLIIPSPDE